MTRVSRPPTPGMGDGDEVSLLEIATAILRQWRLIVTLPLLLSLLVGLQTLASERMYTAHGTFVPQSSDGGGSDRVTVLAQQFGVNLGSERAGRTPQFYADLLTSKAILTEVVQTEYTILTEDGTQTGNLVALFDLERDESIYPPARRAVARLERQVETFVDAETGVVEVTVSARHPDLAEDIAARLLETLNTFSTQVRQRRAREESRFISERVAEAESALTAAEKELQQFMARNREFRNSPELLFDYERLQRQVLMRQDIYTSMLRSHEQTGIDAIRDTPLLTVIDHPSGSVEPQGRGVIVRTSLAFLLGLVMAVVVAFSRELLRRSRQTNDPRYRELQEVSRQVWKDVRDPRRWLRTTKTSP